MKNFIKNIICVDLTKFTKSELEVLVEKMPELNAISIDGVSNMSLSYVKAKEFGYGRIYIDKTSKVMIAYTMKSDFNTIIVGDVMASTLSLDSVKFRNNKEVSLTGGFAQYLNKITCIDVTKFSTTDLNRMVEKNTNLSNVKVSLNGELSLDYEVAKTKGYKKLFIDNTSKVLVGFTLKDNPNNFVFNIKLAEALVSMDPLGFPKGALDIETLSLATVKATPRVKAKKEKAFEGIDLTGKSQDVVDAILDKINKTGVDSLTSKEKEFLSKI